MPETDEIELSLSRPMRAEDVAPLFAQTGWAARRTVADIQHMLDATPMKLGAWHGDRLVAMVRVLTDGRYRALIDDVIVDQSFRRQGLGSRMMTFLAEDLNHVDEVFLRCDRTVMPFYEQLGFRQAAICLDLDRSASVDKPK